MKRLLLLAFCLMQMNSLATAYSFQSPLTFIPSSEDVYLVTVIRFSADKVTFAINEVLRGKRLTVLKLKPWKENQYRVGSYWLLVSDSKGASPDCVGFDPKESCGWIPMSVNRKDGQSFIIAETDQVDGIQLDMASDGTKGLTIDHVRKLVKHGPSD